MKTKSRKIFISVLGFAFPLIAGEAATPSTMKEDPALFEKISQAEELRNLGNYDRALELANLALAEAEGLNQPELAVEALYQQALTHYFLNNFDEARAAMEIGRSKARQLGLEILEADFINAEGVLEWKLGHLSLAIPKLEAALEIQRRNNAWVSMASISNNLGIICFSRKDFEAAANYYRQGLAWLDTHENDRLEASLNSNLAEVLIPMGELDIAEECLHKALALELPLKDPHNIAYTYYNMGELNSMRGDSNAAIALFKKALELQLSINDNWAIALTKLKCGSEYWTIHDTERALEELDSGYAIAKEVNALSLLCDYTAVLSDIHSTLGRNELADFYSSLNKSLEQRFRAGKEGGIINSEEDIYQQDTALAQIQPDAGSYSWVQAATILLLCLLIATLVIENTRLRKRSRSL